MMAMPETTVHKNHRSEFRKYYIRFSGQVFVMQTKAKTKCMKPTPHNHLWFCVFAPDTRHHPASDLGRNRISHSR
ncbi:hypothetical protein DFR52_103559 [Hoeflea marina]|uniref:Uncharacterized protein n=1 Tax=Hoeflea marina TaxID=274592 RepID=A0A317PKF2_9HYPH|nr:hypothetical protein DFR52_103559 [Hoeflea marina]